MIKPVASVLVLALMSIGLWGQPQAHPWPTESDRPTLVVQIQPPPGYQRLNMEEDSFGSWLRQLPLREDTTVYLYDGRVKPRQDVQSAVIDIDIGNRDLQQCADAVMRLRAEYLLARGRDAEIGFNFTSGHPATWLAWREGQRPKVSGSQVVWQKRSEPDASYANFRRYLTTVFVYAGTASLVRELNRVPDPLAVSPGQVFIQGGFPGHAVLVMDVAENQRGERVFLLAQSYMPAQNMHILRQPNKTDPWYPAKAVGELVTPEWAFRYTDLYTW